MGFFVAEWAFASFYSFPLWVLYMRVMCVLSRRPPDLNSVFFRIVYVGGILDCVLFPLQFALRLSNSDMFGDWIMRHFGHYTYWLSPYMYGHYHLMHAVQATPLLMAANRMTSICLPLAHDQIWRHWRKYFFALFFLLPFVCFSWLLLNPAGFRDNPDSDLWFNYTGLDFERRFQLILEPAPITATYTTLFAVLTFLMNVACVARLSQLKLRGDHDRELNLVICSMIVFVAQAGLVAVQLAFTNSLVDVLVLLRFILPTISDLMIVTPALIITLTIGNLRRAALYLQPSTSFVRQSPSSAFASLKQQSRVSPNAYPSC